MWLFYSCIRGTQEYINVGLYSNSFVQKEDFILEDFLSQGFILAIGLIVAVVLANVCAVSLSGYCHFLVNC